MASLLSVAVVLVVVSAQALAAVAVADAARVNAGAAAFSPAVPSAAGLTAAAEGWWSAGAR